MSQSSDLECHKRHRWYFGSIASTCASWCTHPMDLVKVQMQTPNQIKQKEKHLMTKVIKKIFREQGIPGFYNGLTAATMLRVTSSGARIGIYEGGKNHLDSKSLPRKFLLATIAGLVSAGVGMPFDKVNIRMQNDAKLPPKLRMNYKHVFDGLRHIYLEEGFQRFYDGYTMAAGRGVLLAIGQNMSYDYAKSFVLTFPNFTDGLLTHLTASFMAGVSAVLMTQPFDVLKTRVMNDHRGEYKGVMDAIFKTALEGPLAFYKGTVPAIIRMGPQTVLLYVFLEQLRINFGFYDKDSPCYEAEIIDFKFVY